MRQRVALCIAAFVSYFFVAAGERDGLEGEELNLLWIVERELNDAPDLFVVDTVDDRRDRNDINAGAVEILDRAQLYVEEVPDLAMFVGRVADSVELQIRISKPRFRGLIAELRALCELDSVCRGLHAVVSNLARVSDRIQEVRRHCRLAA